MSVPLMKGHPQCRDTSLDTGVFVEEGNYCIIFFLFTMAKQQQIKADIKRCIYIYIYIYIYTNQNNKCYVEVLHVTIMLVV